LGLADKVEWLFDGFRIPPVVVWDRLKSHKNIWQERISLIMLKMKFNSDALLPLFYITLTLVARNCKLQLTHEHEGIKSVLEIDIVCAA
jgi:hypothetical protein